MLCLRLSDPVNAQTLDRNNADQKKSGKNSNARPTMQIQSKFNYALHKQKMQSNSSSLTVKEKRNVTFTTERSHC